jgi:hypothetical protein
VQFLRIDRLFIFVMGIFISAREDRRVLHRPSRISKLLVGIISPIGFQLEAHTLMTIANTRIC